MKPRLHIGWVLFALVMVWAECLGDVPRLLSPHRVSPGHYAIALMNLLAVVGLAFYALRVRASRAFWRVFAPVYAIMVAAQFGSWLPPFTVAVARIMRAAANTPFVAAGVVAATLPLLAMSLFTMIACFRLGDWIGPTRRPVGVRGKQLSLPI
jgi:hypothetical protein